ncbi:MAG: ParB/RepB/Spo0J family partition protein [Rickettsiales bacterium]|nr:ParB/RepB/Spo0J family partition protein [Rickettsiales bacterium]
MKKVGGLGKGLSALISERKIDVNSISEANGKREEIQLKDLFPSRFQPRIVFNQEELIELSESIKRNGVVQPILVRKRQGQGYEIIAGERRWRASKLANLNKIPAIILEVDDRAAMEIALVENIQRQNLNALEEAEGYKRLINEFNYTQEQLADVVGKSRSHITNLLRLLSLPDNVKELLNSGDISTGHARAILAAPNQEEAANIVVSKNYSVRQTENLVKRLTSESGGLVARKKSYARKKKNNDVVAFSVIENNLSNEFSHDNLASEVKEKEPEILMMEEEISQKSGLQVEINNQDESGEVVIKYSSMEELNRILFKLEHGVSEV